MRQSFSRLGRKQVAAVFKNGRFFTSPFLNIKAAPAPAGGGFAFILPSKEVRSAVQRNRLRRRARAVIQFHRRSLKTGYNVVLVLRRGLLGLPFPQLTEAVLRPLKRAGLML